MASSSPATGQEITLVLLGKTGNGKSATGNTILERTAFATADGSNLKTRNVTLNCSQRDDGSRVRVIDTPGVMDRERPYDCALSNIYEALSFCPNGLSALIIVLKFGCRYTKEEKASLFVLKNYFGRRFLKDFGIIVITQGDNFDLHHTQEIPFEDWLRNTDKGEQDESFGELLEECSNRCVLFYNVGRKYDYDRKKGVATLLSLIKHQIPTPYKGEQIKIARSIRIKKIKEQGNPFLCTAVQEQLSLMIERVQRDALNNTLSWRDILKQLEKLDKEVDGPVNNLNTVTDKLQWKTKITSVRNKWEAKEKEKENAAPIEILKDLENLKEIEGKDNDDLGKRFIDNTLNLKRTYGLYECYGDGCRLL